ncbi:Vsp/OspC family lipoprotein [Borrelia parkeri]|uniref:Vsp/OspC family lipoprotein n=1 Tax=Borrelia parkeri TaxID=141 RepID=UPI0032B18615
MKRITFCALLMTLFLLMSCNNSGTSPKDGQAAKSDGTLIDLKSVSSKITEAVAFANDVKDVHTLVKSIDELVKAIGQKIKNDGIEAEKDHNGSLIVGAYSVILAVETKLTSLEKKVGLSSDLKGKVTAAKTESTAFLTTVKSKHTDLGKEGVTDAHAKNAIDKSDNTGDKGASDLVKLNTAIDALLTSANAAVTAAIKELTTPAKPSNN